jgi:hypothetical protein
VNLLALGKEPWRFKYLEDQLNIYRQQWQTDLQKQIIANMAGKMSGKSNDGKRKKMEETIIIPIVVAVAFSRAIMTKEDAVDAEEVAAEEAATIVSI